VFTLEELLCCTLLESANDAAVAVAIAVGGSIEDFAAMMNEKCAELGLVDTHFTNPHGLDDDEHYTTARELGIIAAAALENEALRKIFSTYKMTVAAPDGGVRMLINHNRLLRSIDGCIGVKTGFTKKDGRCLVSAAERDGITLVAVTLNAPNDWSDHTKMLDYGFSHTELKTIVKKGDILKKIDGDGFYVNAVAKESISVPAKINSGLKSEIILHTVKKPTLEILKGEKIGYAQIICDGEEVKKIDLVADRNAIPKKNKTLNSLLNKVIKILRGAV
jgi:D-alanyl-D-alanine carboxypeptidase